MPIRFETFAFLPPLSNQQIEAQITKALNSGWVPHVEYAEQPNSADFFWRIWPLKPTRIEITGKGQLTSSQILNQIESCARRYPFNFVRFCAYSPQTRMTEMAFICKTPQEGQ